MTFSIQNRLEILRGNKILVPGCEPTSAFSSPTLAENRDCTMTVVDLQDAIAAIPNATIVSWGNPRTRFFVLPAGPPPAMGDCNCNPTDWYQILRDIGNVVEADSSTCNTNPYSVSVGDICSATPMSIKSVFG